MKREELLGMTFGLQFIRDVEIRDDDVMLTLEAELITRWREQRFGSPVDPPIMTRAAISTVRGKDYKHVERISNDGISIRLVPIQAPAQRGEG